MKKSTIWLLAIVMAITIGALLYFQIIYLERMVKMREEQFSGSVMRSLYATSGYLERQETLHFLEQDANVLESFYSDEDGTPILSAEEEGSLLREAKKKTPKKVSPRGYSQPNQNLSRRYQRLREVIRTQYLYQKGLLNEVILTILRDAESRPVIERADSSMIRSYLRTELANNGLDVPFAVAVFDARGNEVYETPGFESKPANGVYSQLVFPNSSNPYLLSISFPTKRKYIFQSVRFIIPTLAFTLILVVVFVYTIILAFRQKKLSEMKTDFINNMTHELKTPISTVSLAAQMLNDPSVLKSPASLQHISQIITEESKRLRFQAEKVLQMSVFDNSSTAVLKFTALDANAVVSNVVNTFKIKVEKFGGSLGCVLNAKNSRISVDEMQFTNVIFNLLENAVKYRREDVDLHLEVVTSNPTPDTLEIRVKDNGIGIKRENLKKIFEKFYRVSTGNRHDVKGFGLGLAYVRKMVTLFHGSISVESDFGEGTTFIITLPTIAE